MTRCILTAFTLGLWITSTDALGSPQYCGTRSCTTTGCHGRLEDSQGDVRLTEFQTWLADDRHSQACSNLLSENGRKILANLLGPDAQPTDQHAIRVWTNCLNCHNTTSELVEGQAFTARIAEGVGCEACHGPARNWKDPHWTDGFRKLDWAAKSQAGLRQLGDVTVKAEACVRCHAGGDGIVDHDLIAAGHPALKFELSTYVAAMPAHWKRRERGDVREGRAEEWLAGQIATARAAISLVERRSRSTVAAGRNRLPIELAEYDCGACHHRLKDGRAGDAIGSGAGSETIALAGWGIWNLGLVDVAAREESLKAPPEVSRSLEALRAALDTHRPGNAAQVGPLCDSASSALARWQSHIRSRSAPAILPGVQAVACRHLELISQRSLNWDRSVQQLYLQQALSDRPAEALAGELQFVRYRSRHDDPAYRDELRNLFRAAFEPPRQ